MTWGEKDTSPSVVFLPNPNSPTLTRRKTSDKMQTEEHSTWQWIFHKTIFLKTIKHRDSLRSCHRLEDTRTTWHLTAMWCPKWDPRTEKGHGGNQWNLNKVWCLVNSNVPVNFLVVTNVLQWDVNMRKDRVKNIHQLYLCNFSANLKLLQNKKLCKNLFSADSECSFIQPKCMGLSLYCAVCPTTGRSMQARTGPPQNGIQIHHKQEND